MLDELEKPAAAVGYLVGLPQMDNSVASVSICKQLRCVNLVESINLEHSGEVHCCLFRIDDSSLLYNHLAVVFFSLHLVHEVSLLIMVSLNLILMVLFVGDEIELSFSWKFGSFSTTVSDCGHVRRLM